MFYRGTRIQYDFLNEKIASLNLQNHVKLLNWISDITNAEFLNGCDVFVFPSLHESFGIVLIEALACGKPCVATINGGSEGILTSDKLGVLIPPANAKALADAITYVLEGEWDQTFIANVAMEYNWEDIASKTRLLYEQL